MTTISATSDRQLRSRAAAPVRTVIEPSRGWSALGLREVWDRRELLLFLVVREIQGTHRQTALGLSWIFLRPIVQMALLSLVARRRRNG